MARNNRIFLSFAVEDKTYRDLLVGQARNKNSPFEFVDMVGQGALGREEPWNGKGGTADVVADAIRRGVPPIHIAPTSRTVRQLANREQRS